jgi:hypothetical protein
MIATTLGSGVGLTKQDATRRRRTRDEVRRQWYAHWRSLRWARHFFQT